MNLSLRLIFEGNIRGYILRLKAEVQGYVLSLNFKAVLLINLGLCLKAIDLS
jgi:hypothetical protein